MKLNSSSTAFVFPGQGSQVVGMGKDLASAYDVARNIFEEADSILHFPFSKLMWDGPESELNDTVNTQPALFVHSMASFRVFSHLYPDLSLSRWLDILSANCRLWPRLELYLLNPVCNWSASVVS